MANPTTNFGWVMPAATDLVTDLPADFNVFGQGVDTSMQYLLGGTTGQILSKTSATNMAFTWITNDVGDITAVTAGNGISGGGTSGAVTISIDTAITVDKTTAQTLTNKTLTSPALTTPTISTLTTNGDLIYGTGSGALARLGIGSSAQFLTVSSGLPAWTNAPAPASNNNYVATTQTTTSTSYTALATAQAVTLTTGTKVMVVVGCFQSASIAEYMSNMSYAISGATTSAASDDYSVAVVSSTANDKDQQSYVSFRTVTAGSNTFTAQFKTETGSTGSFSNRTIAVIDLGS